MSTLIVGPLVLSTCQTSRFNGNTTKDDKDGNNNGCARRSEGMICSIHKM